jgi:hypothetical protein
MRSTFPRASGFASLYRRLLIQTVITATMIFNITRAIGLLLGLDFVLTVASTAAIARFRTRTTGARHYLDASRANLALQLQLALVFFEERAELFRAIEQAQPLFVIERYGEAPQAVNADRALLAHLELQGARLALANLLFQLGDAREQFLFGGFRQFRLSPRSG